MTIKAVTPLKRIVNNRVFHLSNPTYLRGYHSDESLSTKAGLKQELFRPIFRSRSFLRCLKGGKMPPTEHNEPDIWDSNSVKKDVIAASHVSHTPSDDEPIWVFGYGSLIWKVNFPYTRKLTGYIKGFTRRFWQGSTDHRGFPGKPGRVVTLVPKEKEITWGVAYEVLPASVPEVMAYLNHREKGGYTLHSVGFHPKDENLIDFSVYVYIATECNEEYLGDAPMADIARQIATSRGPSGENSEYLLMLAKAVKEMGVEDDHLFELEKRVREEIVNNSLKLALKATDANEPYPLSTKIIVAEKELDRQD